MSFAHPDYAFRPVPDMHAMPPARHPVVVIGAGPVGLSLAIDLALRGTRVVLLDEDNTVSVGSRGICYAKRTLEIFDRLGCAAPMLDKGVTWQVGKVFFGEGQVYSFDLLPESGHRFPAFINLQQYWLEKFLVDRAQAMSGLDLRWKSRVSAIEPRDSHVALTVETPGGSYALDADWVVACDGARSPTRKALGLDFRGRVFEDRFLIADVRMKAAFPSERWFWFEPPFHSGGSTLLHKQPDDLWRIDFQLGWNADPEAEKDPARVAERVRAMLGPDAQFDLEWVSVYTFQCRRLERFRHGRVLFAGDAAHQVSPFGARGANSGVQDADNLAWKLAAVVAGDAPESLLDSYEAERTEAADENILNSTRATDFITPKNAASRVFRDATLELARDHAFARRLVNSGRLSVPTRHAGSPLSSPDTEAFDGGVAPGAPALDAPDGAGWLLDRLKFGFSLLLFGAPDNAAFDALTRLPVPVHASAVPESAAAAWARYDAKPGTAYLFRPDQLVCWRARRLDLAAIEKAQARALAKEKA
ncbi:MAG: FAD-dependent oxidoreductase [Alphaproteobacteria bacterium]|nr:FAD-dependent oxidoreductase [Alphaproteobacteria bacterium]